MKRPHLVAVAVCVLVVSACGDGQDYAGHGGGEDGSSCTLIGCEDGVDVDLGTLAARDSAELPLTLHACLDSGCFDFVLSKTNGVATCTRPAAGTVVSASSIAICSVDRSGDVRLLLPPGDDFSADAAHVFAISIESNGAVLFSKAEEITFTSSQPNGPGCEPTCHQAALTIQVPSGA